VTSEQQIFTEAEKKFLF
jgi:hypothetical protein